MSETSELYGTVASGFAKRVEGCPAESWSAASPCSDWTARDVVTHVIDSHRRVLANVSSPGEEPVADNQDLLAAFHAASTDILAALSNPEQAAQAVGGRFGDMSFENLVGGVLCADTLVHTWDLAKATGQDENLDINAVQVATAALLPLDKQIRVPGGFGPIVEAPEGAGDQTRLLCFAGRQG